MDTNLVFSIMYNQFKNKFRSTKSIKEYICSFEENNDQIIQYLHEKTFEEWKNLRKLALKIYKDEEIFTGAMVLALNKWKK